MRACVVGSLSSSGLAYVLHCSVLEAYKIYVYTLVFYNEHNTSIYICIYITVYTVQYYLLFICFTVQKSHKIITHRYNYLSYYKIDLRRED